MATAAGRGPGPCARCARCTIRSGPRTAMSATLAAGVAGVRPARCVSMADAARGVALRQGCRRSSPRRSRRRCWRRRRRSARAAASEGRPSRHASRARRDRRRRRGAGQCAAGRRSRPNRSPAACRRAATAASRIAAGHAGAAVPRPRRIFPRSTPPRRFPPVIPIVRAPDDPGIDDEASATNSRNKSARQRRQAGGWRGFLSRWGG